MRASTPRLKAAAMTSCEKERSFHPELSAATTAKTAASWRNVLKATQRLLAHATLRIRHTLPPYVQTHSHTTICGHSGSHGLTGQNKLLLCTQETFFLSKYRCERSIVLLTNYIYINRLFMIFWRFIIPSYNICKNVTFFSITPF